MKNNQIKVDAQTKLLELTYNSLHFGLDGTSRLSFRFETDGGLIEDSGGSALKLADTSLSLSTFGLQVKADVIHFDIGTSGLQPKVLCTGIDTGTPLSLNSSKLKLDYDTEYSSIKNNDLFPLFELKG
jgi:hypothetical protein